MTAGIELEMVATGGPSAERGAAAPADGLPCQYKDNCIEKEKYQPLRSPA